VDWRIDLKDTGAKPKYQHLMDFVAAAIAAGRLRPGDRVPSVAALSKRLRVNQATVVRAFRELERRRLLVSRVGRGSFVAAATRDGADGRGASGTGVAGAGGGAAPGAAAETGPPSRSEVARLIRRLRHAHVSGMMQLLGVEPPAGAINMWSGVPPEATVPKRLLEQAAVRACRRDGETLLRYAHYGLPRLREALSVWLRSRGYRLPPEQILITNGSQQALALVAQWALDDGRLLLCETPTYLGIPRLFSQTGHVVSSVPRDGRQIRIDALGPARFQRAAFYLCPDFHNPTGECLGPEGRQAIADLAARNDLMVVVDDIFRDMRFAGTETVSLYEELPPSRRVLVGSFSKSFIPGLRVGFLAADRPLIEELLPMKRYMDLGGSILPQAVMADLLPEAYPKHLRTMRPYYRERRDALVGALERLMPEGVTFTRPEGGFQLWVQMPPGFSSIQVYLQAIERGVCIYPGPAHDIDGRYGHCFRLGYGCVAPDAIRRAVETLAGIVKGMLKNGPAEPSVTGVGLPV
jgi:DNA-binding transcriptional MocR family regulator